MRAIIFVVVFLSAIVQSEESCEIAKLSHLLGAGVANEDLMAVQFALELGANPNGLSESEAKRCFSGMPSYVPVLLAAGYEDLSILKLLLTEGASPNIGCCGSSALGVAELNTNKEAAKLIRAHGGR